MENKSQRHLDALFSSIDNPNYLLKELLHKSSKDKKIQQNLAIHLGLKSKSSISELINDKRNIPLKHLSKISSFFKLSSNQSRVFEYLIKLKVQKDRKLIQSLQDELKKQRKSLFVKREKLPKFLVDTPLAFEVFASFGLLEDDEVSFERIESFFGKKNKKELTGALKSLEELKLIARKGHYYSLNENNILFDQFSSFGPPIKIIEYFMERSKQDLRKWFEKGELACFTSSVISTKKSHYQKLLKNLKEEMESYQNDLEDEEADMLVSFNTQIYPLLLK